MRVVRIQAQGAVIMRNGAGFAAEVVEGLGEFEADDGVARVGSDERLEPRQGRARADGAAKAQRLAQLAIFFAAISRNRPYITRLADSANIGRAASYTIVPRPFTTRYDEK